MSKQVFILGDSLLDGGVFGFKATIQNHQTIGPSANLNLGEFLSYKLINKIPRPYYEYNSIQNKFIINPLNTNFAVSSSTFAPPFYPNKVTVVIPTQVDSFIVGNNIFEDDIVLIDGGFNDFSHLLKECFYLKTTNDTTRMIRFFENVNLLFPGYDPSNAFDSILIIINDYLNNGILPIVKTNFDKIIATKINKMIFLNIGLNRLPNLNYYPPILNRDLYLLSDKNDIETEKLFEAIQPITEAFNLSLRNYYNNNSKFIMIDNKIALDLIIYDIYLNNGQTYGIINYTQNTVPVLLDNLSSNYGLPLYGFINNNDGVITPFISNNPTDWNGKPIVSQVPSIPITAYNGLYCDMYHPTALGHQAFGNIIFNILRDYII